MDRYSGRLGIRIDSVEIEPGIFDNTIYEIPITGKILRQNMRWTAGELSQDSINAGHTISLVASDTLLEQLVNVVYATLYGRKWVVRSVERAYPRVNLVLGKVYDER